MLEEIASIQPAGLLFPPGRLGRRERPRRVEELLSVLGLLAGLGTPAITVKHKDRAAGEGPPNRCFRAGDSDGERAASTSP